MQTVFLGRIAFYGILLLATLDVVLARAQSKLVNDKPIDFLDCQKIQGSESIIVPGATILIGEIHGTWETPIVVATLARQALNAGAETILCVEVSASDQASLDRFLDSDGGADSKSALLKQSHWMNQDGRASIGMYAMFELLRRLRSEEKRVQVVAIDCDWNVPEENLASLSPEKLRQLEELAKTRDAEMAKAVIQTRAKSDKAVVIAYTGNVHTRVIKGTAWDPDYLPMGWYVSQQVKNLVSLDVDHANGQAWVSTEKGSGPTRFSGKDQGATPFVTLFENASSGYHGKLYVGRITAAEPAGGKKGR